MIKRLFTLLTATAFLAAVRQLLQRLETQLVQLKAHPLIPQRQHLVHQALLLQPLPQVQGNQRVQALRASLQKWELQFFLTLTQRSLPTMLSGFWIAKRHL